MWTSKITADILRKSIFEQRRKDGKKKRKNAGRNFFAKKFLPAPICANFRFRILIPIPPSPSPLPRGERVLESPSLDGRGKGEGDNYLISLTQVVPS
jgi:hypothetical protein